MKVKETAVKYRTTKKPFTYQDYLQLPDDGKRYEVINGELIMAPSPITIHQIISTSLSAGLFNYVKENELGTILTAPLDVVLNETNVYQPDIIFISRERKEIITEKNISGAPDLV
ncbi:MAG: Uma2 family endonuclease, partial [Caldisericaceae bacterium]|nr:Uma2 family endonuclease [Caldisericaceae bacterium]